MKMNDIDNTKLEEAIQAYIKQPGREALIQLVGALQDGQLFVPAVAIPKQRRFQPYVIKNQAGVMYMPAFTCQDRLPKNQKYQGVLKLQYKQCVSMLLDNPVLVEGIALNPYTDNLMLTTKMLELSRKMEQQAPRVKAASIKTDDFRMIVRHNVEFKLLPKKLFEKKLEFIHSLSPETLQELYREPYVDLKQEAQYAYTADDFEIMELNISDELNIMQIVLPSRFLYKTNCREAYIIWNPVTERIGCYVIELGAEPNKTQYYLDEIKEDGSWENLGEAPSEGNVISRIMELFEASEDA